MEFSEAECVWTGHNFLCCWFLCLIVVLLFLCTGERIHLKGRNQLKMVHPKGRKGREELKIVQPRTLGASNSILQKIQEARKNLLWTVDVFWLVIPSENVTLWFRIKTDLVWSAHDKNSRTEHLYRRCHLKLAVRVMQYFLVWNLTVCTSLSFSVSSHQSVRNHQI